MPRNTRFTNELMMRLDRVADVGEAEIGEPELKNWYGQQRATVSIWRDLAERWDETLQERVGFGDEDRTTPLLVGYSAGRWILIWGRGLTTDGTWLRDVRDMAN
jgi:hypothetical protein